MQDKSCICRNNYLQSYKQFGPGSCSSELGIDNLPTVNFDGRTTSAFYAVETILGKISDIISDADRLITEIKKG